MRARYRAFLRVFLAYWAHSERNDPVRGCQASRQHKVGQRGQAEQLRGVLGQPAITQLPMPEQVLHHVEQMFNDRPHLRVGTLPGPGRLALGALLSHLFQRDSPIPGLLSIQWFHHKTLNRNE